MCPSRRESIWWWNDKRKKKNGLKTSVGLRKRLNAPAAHSNPLSSLSRSNHSLPLWCDIVIWTKEMKTLSTCMKDSSIIRSLRLFWLSNKLNRRGMKRIKKWPSSPRLTLILRCQPTGAISLSRPTPKNLPNRKLRTSKISHPVQLRLSRLDPSSRAAPASSRPTRAQPSRKTPQSSLQQPSSSKSNYRCKSQHHSSNPRLRVKSG